MTLFEFVGLAVVGWASWRVGRWAMRRCMSFQPMNEKERDIGQAVPPSGRPHAGSGVGFGYPAPGMSANSEIGPWVPPHKRKSKWDR